MLEWYQKGISFRAFIQETLDFLFFTAERLESPWAKHSTPFTWLTLQEAFLEFVGIELIDQDPEFAAKAKECGVYSIGLQDDFETAFFKVLLEKIEPQFQALERVVLYDYPPSQAALAKVEGPVAKRFEVYVAGVELCNGFFEATDAQENQLRFEQINMQRESLGKELLLHDEGFFQALATPIPPCCGNALGLDRWLALLLGASGLDDVLLFR